MYKCPKGAIYLPYALSYTQIITYMHSRILEHSNDQLLKVLAFEDFHIATQIMVNSMNGGSKASKK